MGALMDSPNHESHALAVQLLLVPLFTINLTSCPCFYKGKLSTMEKFSLVSNPENFRQCLACIPQYVAPMHTLSNLSWIHNVQRQFNM